MCFSTFEIRLDFSGNNAAKKPKTSIESSDLTSEDSVFKLLTNQSHRQPTNQRLFEANSAAKYITAEDDEIDEDEEEQKPTEHVPFDWSLKLKLRMLSNVQIPGCRLKSSEEASGITG